MNARSLISSVAAVAIALSAHTLASDDEIILRPTPAPLGFGEGRFGLTYTPAPVCSIVSGDFNNDGHPDLAWISDNDPDDEPDSGSRVTIATGFGDGRFLERLVLDQPGTELLAADFNGDGLTDLAIGGSTLIFRYNRGGMNFSPPVNTGIPCTQTSPYGLSLIAVDVDLDTDLDIIITDASGRLDTAINVFSIFYLVEGSRSLTAFHRPRVLDFDGDSIPDLIFRDNLSTLLLRRGLGDGTFDTPLPGFNGYSAINVYSPPPPARPVVIAKNSFTSRVTIIETRPQTGLAPLPLLEFATDSTSGNPDLLDLDADGELDLVLNDQGFFSVFDTHGLGRSINAPVGLTEGGELSDFEGNAGPTFLMIDVNHDSTPDRVEPGYVRLNLRDENILPRHTHHRLAPTLNIHSHVAAADLDNDGYTDLVAAGFEQLELRYGRSTGPANADTPVGPPVSVPHGLENFSGFITLLVDLNNDQRTDIVTLDRTPRVVAMLNLGNREFDTPQQLTLSTEISDIAGIASGDLDNDNDPDFVVSSDAENQLVTLLNDNGTLSIGPRLDLPPGTYTTVTLLDVNGDTRLDAIVGDAEHNQILIALGLPDASFALVGPVFLPAPPYWLTATDADSDGIDDLLVTTRDETGGDSPILVWHRDAQHTLGFIPTVIPTEHPALEAFCTDLNGDGHNDLVTAQATLDDGGIIVYNGAPQIVGWPLLKRFSTTLVEIDETFPASIIAPDLNADENPDLLWCSNDLRLDLALQNPAPMGPCRTDIQGDTVSDNADISAFIELFISQHPAADLNRDGVIDTADINQFVDLFIAGC